MEQNFGIRFGILWSSRSLLLSFSPVRVRDYGPVEDTRGTNMHVYKTEHTISEW